MNAVAHANFNSERDNAGTALRPGYWAPVALLGVSALIILAAAVASRFLSGSHLTSIGIKNVGPREASAVTLMYPGFIFRFGRAPSDADKRYDRPRSPGAAEVRLEWEDAGIPRCAIVTLKVPLPKKKWWQDYHLLFFLHDTEPPTAGINIWDPYGPLNYEFIDITATTRFTPCLGLTWKDDPDARYRSAGAASP